MVGEAVGAAAPVELPDDDEDSDGDDPVEPVEVDAVGSPLDVEPSLFDGAPSLEDDSLLDEPESSDDGVVLDDLPLLSFL